MSSWVRCTYEIRDGLCHLVVMLHLGPLGNNHPTNHLLSQPCFIAGLCAGAVGKIVSGFVERLIL